MKYLSLFSIIILTGSISGYGQSGSSTNPLTDRQQIELLEVEWNTINEVSDPDGKRRLLADDSYHVGPSGKLYDKAGDIRTAVQSNASRNPSAVHKFVITGTRIRMYKNAAVVTGKGRSVVSADAVEKIGRPFRFVHVWEKRKGEWLLVVDQVTAVQ